MNAKNRSASRVGLVAFSALAAVVAGCTSSHVHTRTVYVPTPPPPPRVVPVTPPPAPQPAPVVVVSAPAPVPPPQPAPVVVVQQPAPAPVVVIQSESDFYEPLRAHGHWEVVAGYGRCWIPSRVEVGWRPYCNGYWQRTDAGWYWMSDEPWGWATYHYGRWDWHAHLGWFWVPQTQWAPAWVCWREGGGYVGWAPLRPSVTIGVNIHLGDYEPAHASRAYVFVEQRRMLEPVHPKTVIVNNTTIINQTVNITKIKVENKTVINEGPRPDVVERATGRKVRSVTAREVRHQEETTVAARERNLPRVAGKRNESPVRAETRPAAVTAIEQAPVAVTPAKPTPQVTTPVTHTPPARPVVSKIEREATLNNEAPARVPQHEHAVEAKAKPEPKAERATPNRPAARPVDRPAEIVKPAPAPVVATPTRQEVRSKPAPEKVNPVAPQATAAHSRMEVRKETKAEPRLPARVESPTPQVAKRPEVSTPARASQRATPSRNEKPRTEERSDVGKQKDETKGKRKAEPTNPSPTNAPAKR